MKRCLFPFQQFQQFQFTQNLFPSFPLFRTMSSKRRAKVSIAYEKSSSENTGRKRKRTTQQKAEKIQPPEHWGDVWEKIEGMRAKNPAPVDTMGCSELADQESSPKTFRFQTLVSLMLSSQTRDEQTSAAMKRLKQSKNGLSISSIQQMKDEELSDLLYGVGFYNRKTQYIKKAANILAEKYDGDIPRSLEGLVSLPGVGPKMAHLVLQCAWDDVQGIAVDVHVHRISGRLGWTQNASKPEDARVQLEDWVPKDKWRSINTLLVGFGQTICKPVGPLCGQCSARTLCPFGQHPRQKVKRKNKKKQKEDTDEDEDEEEDEYAEDQE